MTPIRRCGTSIAAVWVLAVLGAAPALGATHTWIGPAGGKWSASGNWSGGVPTSGEPGGTIVQFASNTTSTMDIVGLTIDQVHFTGEKNTISGTTTLSINGSNLFNNVLSEGAENTLASTLPIATTGGTLLAKSTVGTLTLAGVVSGSQQVAFEGQGGSLLMNANNTYTGATGIISGALHITTPAGVVITGSSIRIGTGGGTGAELVLDNSSDISPETAIVVEKDGLLEGQNHADTAKSLTINGGRVRNAGLSLGGALTMKDGTVAYANNNFSVGSLNMTGGSITGSGTGVLLLGGEAQATSSLSGPATLATGVRLSASPTFTVNAGTAPELTVTGPISETGGSRGLTKAGTGTMKLRAANTYTGTTTVSAGTLIAEGGTAGAVTVGANGTLEAFGTVGPLANEGVLVPLLPGLKTGALSFGSNGRLDMVLNSIAPEAVPSLSATGSVAISPSAALNLVFTPGIPLPHTGSVQLIGNDEADAIGGRFTGIPNGFVLNTTAGVPMLVNYAGGDGNDLSLTPGNIPPLLSSITATPSPAASGQAIAMSVTASDANQDPLTTSWSFGDGSTGTGATTSHSYTTPGSYTIVATVFDGASQVQSTAVITVAVPVGAGPTQPTPVNTPPLSAGGTSTVSSSAYGASFGLAVPRACLTRGSAFTASLSIKKLKGKFKGAALAKITKVLFMLGAKTLRTVKVTPYRAKLTVPAAAVSGSSLRVVTKAYLKLHGGTSQTKTLTAIVRVC
jgi:autotransporter-associated beta strand protein